MAHARLLTVASAPECVIIGMSYYIWLYDFYVVTVSDLTIVSL